MLVTIATVGYGDITPDSELGRFSAMLMIVIAIILVPQMTNALLEKLARQVYTYGVYLYLCYQHTQCSAFWIGDQTIRMLYVS